MQYGLVNYFCKLQLAVFMTAFCFFAHANEYTDYSSLQGVAPKSVTGWTCTVRGVEVYQNQSLSGCNGLASSSFEERFCQGQHGCQNLSVRVDQYTEVKYGFYVTGERCTGINSGTGECYRWEEERATESIADNPNPMNSCPPDTDPDFNYPDDPDGDGNIDRCLRTSDVNDYINSLNQNALDDDFCKGLLLDGGNNTSSNACYTSADGKSCSVSQVSTTYGSETVTYYIGDSSQPLGCAESGLTPFDNSGSGDNQDGCMAIGNESFCLANKDTHCSNIGGTEICDDGCFTNDSGDLFCDASIHPDVGDGQADKYFDDSGTCSVTAGSAYRGICEELGGTWDDTQDYQNASCPNASLAGTCSNGTSVTCYSCIDAGGGWTPDSAEPLTKSESGINDLLGLTQSTNQTLSTIENTNRKTGQATVAAVNTSGAAVTAQIKETGNKTNQLLEQLVEKTDEPTEKLFTISSSVNDKAPLDSLFTDLDVLHSEIDALKTNFDSVSSSIRTEASSLFNVEVVNSGYAARTLSTTHGDFDLSLNRFSNFFQQLGNAVLLICSVLVLIIILKD